MSSRYSALFSCLLFAISAFSADQVTLTNGDRFTGDILKSDGKTLTLKTELAGTIEIQWSGVKELASDHTLTVTSGAEHPYSGIVAARDGVVTITAGPGDVRTVPQAEVKALRTPTEQLAYEKSLNPPLYRGWNGGINVGFALTGGNSKTTNLGVAFTAARPTLTDKWNLYANSVYATNNAPGVTATTTANNITAGARYDRNITKRLFGFVNTDFQTNELQELDLRSLFGGGLGFHAIKGERTTLDLLGGANYTHETYWTLSRSIGAMTIGDEFMHKIGAGTTLVQKLFFYPDMSNFGEHHTTFDLSTVTKLSKWLGWQNSFSDIYVSNPPAGARKNDIIFTTGLNIAFTH
ncbi:MAG TPA: DUF481 domain-containing protein [Terriglobales bacterium]|nr:DUF481 domain-containing protein [Terriglobales bacterium]